MEGLGANVHCVTVHSVAVHWVAVPWTAGHLANVRLVNGPPIVRPFGDRSPSGRKCTSRTYVIEGLPRKHWSDAPTLVSGRAGLETRARLQVPP